MEIFKRTLAILLAIFLLAATTGCSTGSESPVTTSGDSSTSASTPLNVWAIESPSITDYETNAQSVWMEDQTGVEINWLAVPQHGWYDAFKSSVMSGEKVDIYLYPFSTSEVEVLAGMSYLTPLEDLINEENTPNLAAILEANPELKQLITAPDGHIYTLFSNNVYNQTAYTQKLWVNRAFLETYIAETDADMPETTAEFKEMLVYFNTHDMNKNGQQDEIAYMGQSGVEGLYNLFGSFIPSNSSGSGFGCYTTDSGEISFAYREEAFKEALSYVQSLYSEGVIHADTFTITTKELYNYTSGDAASVRVGVVAGASIENIVQLTEGDNAIDYDDYIALPPMAGPNGIRSIMTTGETTVELRNAITAQCSDPEAAIKWLDAGYSEAARMFAVYGGLENENWKYAQGETINGAGQVITALTQTEENSSWRGQGIVYSITEEDYRMMDITQLATNAALANYKANLSYRPYAVLNNWPPIVWAGENADAAAEYSEINGLLQQTVTNYYTEVVLGKKNLTSDWDAYTQEIAEIGADRFIELVQLYVSAGS